MTGLATDANAWLRSVRHLHVLAQDTTQPLCNTTDQAAVSQGFDLPLSPSTLPGASSEAGYQPVILRDTTHDDIPDLSDSTAPSDACSHPYPTDSATSSQHEAAGRNDQRIFESNLCPSDLLVPNQESEQLSESTSSAQDELAVTVITANKDEVLYPEANQLEPYAGFCELEHDILVKIFHSLPYNEDRKALTEVARRFYKILVPELYHAITVDMSQYPHLLTLFNRVLRKDTFDWDLVRRLHFDPTIMSSRRRPPAGIHGLASWFVDHCPHGDLEYFSWPVDYPLTASLTRSLWTNHKCLQNLEIWEATLLDWNADVKIALDQMKYVNSLRLSPTTRCGLHHVSTILKNLSTIEALHVDLETFTDPEGELVTDLQADIVPVILFKHILPTKAPSSKMWLSQLKLCGVNLLCSKEWFKAIDILTLRELELSRCKHTGLFLKCIIFPEGTKCPLKSLKVKHFNPETLPELEIVEGLIICLIQLFANGCKLRVLWLQIRGHAAIVAPFLIAHLVPRLDTLYLDIFGVGRRTKGSTINHMAQRVRLEEMSGSPGEVGKTVMVEATNEILSKATTTIKHLAIPWPLEDEGMVTHFTRINPATLRVLAYQQHGCVLPSYRDVNGLVQNRFGQEGRRLRAIAATLIGEGTELDKTEHYIKTTVKVGRKDEAKMIPIGQKEVYKTGENVEILMD